MAASYLKQRRRGWYAQVAVPAELQTAVGAKVLVRSLQTADRAEAERRKHAVLADFQAILEMARNGPAVSPPLPQETPSDLLALARRIRVDIDAGTQDAAQAEAGFDAITDDFLDQQADALGRDEDGHPLLPVADLATITRAHAIVEGRRDPSLSALLEEHLKELRADAETRTDEGLRLATVDAKQRHIGAFLEWFGADRAWTEVRRSTAVDYLRHLKEQRTGKSGKGPPLSRSSIVKWLSDLRVFFRWVLEAEDPDRRPSNPFDGLQPARVVRGKQPPRRHWTPSELSTFLHGVPKDDPMWSLVSLAAYSGARLEELASLRVSSVEGDSFTVDEGKRQASVRRVPVHPVVAPLLSRLVETSGDGFVIPGLLPSGPDGKRGGLVGKRIGYALRKLGISDPRVVFHSLRGTVETLMLSEGVDLVRAQLIVGHERLGSSTPYVSKDSVQDRENRKAISLVSYGEELDRFVSETGPTVRVQTRSRPRKREAA